MDADVLLGSRLIDTPFGSKYFVNADYTASGVVYPPIDEYLRNNVLPFYSNVHSNAANGQRMAAYVTQAKEFIRKAVNAQPCDKLIFTGNGCSGAVIQLIHVLKLHTAVRTSVYVTVAEHHSNYLPWTHLPVTLKIVPVTRLGLIDIAFLTEALGLEPKGQKIICSFIAGSNVTGVLQPVYEIADLVHRFNGLIFFDFAASAPYVPINIHLNARSYFDAIFLSPHKFLGGPGTPGLLIANAKLFQNEVPFCPGGGTVRFVCKKFNHYIDDPERRETGGTPNIIGCIRAGLVFQLKGELLSYIEKRDAEICAWVHPILEGTPGLKLIGPPTRAKIAQFPVFSFAVHGLHYNMAVVLLNDLFGIQTRGGVSCCSVYAEHLFKLCRKKCQKIYTQIVTDGGVPGEYGWCRVSFHYTMTNAVISYILKAIRFIAKYGANFVPDYIYVPDKNIWEHRRKSLMQPVLLDYHLAVAAEPDVKLTKALLVSQYRAALRSIKSIENKYNLKTF